MAPIELRMGASGAGVFVGCGAGVGLVTPVSLHSIPLLGPLASSLSSSLGQLNSAAGGVGSAARSRVRGLGVRGLDLGAGCGAMLGYGYGAGLFLAPGALQSLTGAAHAAGQRVLAVLPPPLRQAVQDAQQRHLQQQQQQQWSALPQGAALGGVGQQLGNGGLAAASSRAPGVAAASSTDGSGAGSSGRARPPAEPAVPDEQLAQLSRLVVKQQNQLAELQEQVAGLQAAVCRLDPAAPGCKLRA